MCLVGIAWQAHPRYPLVVAANRDEFHSRPAAAADWWPDATSVYGGRDLVAGGSWLGVTRAGRIAVVTNHPARPPGPERTRSRGDLVRDWLTAEPPAPLPASAYLDGIAEREQRYAGFCLIVGDASGLHGFISPPGPTFRRWQFRPGVTALSNAPLEARWPKTGFLKRELSAALAADDVGIEALMALLDTRSPVATPTADNAFARARVTPFIIGAEYGTRASTVVMLDAAGELRFLERSFAADGRCTGESSMAFPVARPA